MTWRRDGGPTVTDLKNRVYQLEDKSWVIEAYNGRDPKLGDPFRGR